MKPNSSKQIIQYGIAHNETNYCCANSSHIAWFKEEKQLLAYLPHQARIIYALPHQHIWRKIFFLPHQNKQNLHAKILRLLEQELPLNLTEIYFDYYIQNTPQNLRVALFALRKNYSIQLALNLSNEVIFDCELHCITRALLHLNQQPLENIEQFYFPYEQGYFSLQPSGMQFDTTLPEQSQLLQLTDSQYSKDEQQLYLKALGASLWNGLASI